MVQYTLFVLFVAFYGIHGGSYQEHDLISSGICYERRNAILSQIAESLLDSRKQIRFVADFRTGAIFEQSWNSSSFKRYSECKVTLQGQVGSGLYLTIRNMNLRRDAKGNCIDTVVIKQSNGKKTTFCYAPSDVPRSFNDPSHMKITIKLDHLLALPKAEDKLHLQMVATPMRECTAANKEELWCDKYDSSSCIHKSFANDGKVNCPSCIDETSCSQLPEDAIVVSNQSLVLTAFISLVSFSFMFGIFFLCLYKSRQCVLRCRNSGNSSNTGGDGNGAVDNGNRIGRGRTRHGRGNVVAGVHSVELRGSSSDLRPSAPALDDKDFPPSYEVLFPTATVASSASGPRTVSTATSPTIPKTSMVPDANTAK